MTYQTSSIEIRTKAQEPGKTFVIGLPTAVGEIPSHLGAAFQPVEKSGLPEFARLPAPRQRCPFSGASRTWLIEHDEFGHYLTRVRQPGRLRGTVFVSVPKLLSYLRRAAAADSTANPSEGENV